MFSVGADVIYAVAWAVFFIGAASCYSRFLPQIRRTREELLEESIHELRREVADLRRLVEATPKAHETDKGGSE